MMNIKFENVSWFGMNWHFQQKNLKRKMKHYDEADRPAGRYNCLAYILSDSSLEYDHHFGLYRTKSGNWVLVEHREEKTK